MSPLKSRPLPPGLNVVGYLRAELGIGESARLAVAAVKASGVPYTTIVYRDTASRQTHPFEGGRSRRALYDTNLVCVNGRELPAFAAVVGPGFFRRRRTIGLWHWETEEVAGSMLSGLPFIDELWVGSEFVRAAVERSADVEAHTFPIPIQPPAAFPALPPRAALGLPDGFLFLFMFDFLSVVERKNPAACIEAFRLAFPSPSGPQLVIKTMNGHLRPAHRRALVDGAGGRPDIHVVDRLVSPRERDAMLAHCDAYVSLHRGEGFGLTMAEAMTYGKPVIATRYSGNLDFMTETNSFLVGFGMTTIPRGCEPYLEGGRWADPDVREAAELMRRVVDDPDERRMRGERARADILRRTPEAAGTFVRRRFAELRTHVPPRELPPVGPGDWTRRLAVRAVRTLGRTLDRAPRGLRAPARLLRRAGGPVARAASRAATSPPDAARDDTNR